MRLTNVAPAAIVSLAVQGLTPGDQECSQGNRLLIISRQEPQLEGPCPSHADREVSAGGSGGVSLKSGGPGPDPGARRAPRFATLCTCSVGCGG